MKNQRAVASSGTRLQAPEMLLNFGFDTNANLGKEMSDFLGDLIAGLEKLGEDITTRIDRMDKEAQTCQERLSDELAKMQSQVKYEQTALAQKS